MRHLIVVCLAFMMGLNVACSRVEDLGKDDLHSEPTIEFRRVLFRSYKSYVVRTEYTYQDDGNSIWVWEDTLSSIIGFYPYLRSEVYDLADVQFHIRSCAQGGSVSVGERTDRYDTALLHIIRSANGEDMDVWIPCKPSELRYRCVVYHLEE